MKAEEKQIIYNLLKTADAYNCGYTRNIFKSQPVFADDIQNTNIQNDNITNITIDDNKTSNIQNKVKTENNLDIQKPVEIESKNEVLNEIEKRLD